MFRKLRLGESVRRGRFYLNCGNLTDRRDNAEKAKNNSFHNR
jgi:hypothetical protein